LAVGIYPRRNVPADRNLKASKRSKEMDTVRFIVEDYFDQENGFGFPTINIYINDNNLIHLIEEIELEYRAPLKMGQPYQQSYVGLHPRYYPAFRNEFLGQTRRPYKVLLTCACLEDLCNSIVARVSINAETVTWQDFKNPFLSAEPGLWVSLQDADIADGFPIDYSSLGPFVFDRKQYIHAVNALE
jgi:hypothetical protein